MSPAQHLPELQVTRQTTVILKDCLYQQIHRKEKNELLQKEDFFKWNKEANASRFWKHHVLQNVTALHTEYYQPPFYWTGSRAFSLFLTHKQDVKLICYHVKEIKDFIMEQNLTIYRPFSSVLHTPKALTKNKNAFATCGVSLTTSNTTNNY